VIDCSVIDLLYSPVCQTCVQTSKQKVQWLKFVTTNTKLCRSTWMTMTILQQLIYHMKVDDGLLWEDKHILLAGISFNRSTITDFSMWHMKS
jgi:hypothetical protein